MQITLKNTSKVVSVDGVPARIWEGTTGGGKTVHAYITRIATPLEEDGAELALELQEVHPPSPVVANLPERQTLGTEVINETGKPVPVFRGSMLMQLLKSPDERETVAHLYFAIEKDGRVSPMSASRVLRHESLKELVEAATNAIYEVAQPTSAAAREHADKVMDSAAQDIMGRQVRQMVERHNLKAAVLTMVYQDDSCACIAVGDRVPDALKKEMGNEASNAYYAAIKEAGGGCPCPKCVEARAAAATALGANQPTATA